MKKYILILFFYSCAVTKPKTIQKIMDLPIPPMTNRQLTDYVLNQDLVIQSQQGTIQKQDSVIQQQNFEIAEIKKGFVYMDSLFFMSTPEGIITFKPNIVLDSLTVKYKLSIGTPDTTQKVILSL